MSFNFTLPADRLMKALKQAKPFVAKRGSVKAFEHVMLQRSQDDIIIVACNGDMRCRIPVGVDRDLVTTSIDDYAVVYLTDIERVVSSMGKADINLSFNSVGKKGSGGDALTERYLIVKDVSSKRQVSVMISCYLDRNEFYEHHPEFTSEHEENSAVINGWDLPTMLSSVRHCVSTEETRYYLNGIYLHERFGKLAAVAADGHRLNLIETETVAGKDFGVIIPTAFCDVIINSMAGTLGKARTRFLGCHHGKTGSPEFIEISLGSFVIQSKLIDGTFPDYSRVMPSKSPRREVTVTSFDRDDLLDQLKKAIKIVGRKPASVGMIKKAGNLTINIRHDDTPAFKVCIPCSVDNGDFRSAFNVHYLSKLLSHMKPGQVDLEIDTNNEPVFFDPDAGIMPGNTNPTDFSHAEERNVRNILMPMAYQYREEDA